MTNDERDFVGELKALLDKYQITFARDVIYYDGDDPCCRFVFLDDQNRLTYFTIDDMVDLQGGWNTEP